MRNTPRRGLDDDYRMLIEDLLDGGVTDGGDASSSEKLLVRLEQDPEARDYLIERAMLHARLRCSLRRRSLTTWAIGPAQQDAPKSASGLWPMVVACLAAAVCLAVVVGGWQVARRPYATVTMGIGTAGLETGRKMWGESHQLRAGVLEIETSLGARIVIEAPAVFRFETPQRLVLSEGRLAADAPPPAKGFTVVTPSGEAIDLGTRFAVDVPESGEAEVHVFDGEVIARGRQHAPTNLRDGEAFSLVKNASMDLRTGAFIRGAEVAPLAAAIAAGQEGIAREAVRRLREDQSLIAVINLDAAGRSPDGAPAGQFRRVQGRWPGSHAGDFTRSGDHLPVDVGGDIDWPQLTGAAWVRLDKLGEPFQSLYHTDGWVEQNPGQVHWMIVDSGVMRMALPGIVLAPDAVERFCQPESKTPVLGSEGRWMHLAFVYDSAARTTTFYVNGQFDGLTHLVVAPPARLGPARIGNWNAEDRKLSGRIDEIVLFGRALSAEEIGSLFDAGVPYR